MTSVIAGARRRLWRTTIRLNGGFEVHGALPPGGCVVVANHCSHADAPSILAALDADHRPVVAAAADYWFERPVKAWVCRSLVAGFPVRRAGGGYADLAAQQPALHAGRAVVVFPAGSRRSVDGRFHQGAFRLAQQAGVPIVPVRLSGTDRAQGGGGLPRRARIVVDIGNPITVADPEVSARHVQTLLRGSDDRPPTTSPPGARVRLAALATSPTGCLITFCWAMAEAVSWPILAELLIAALVLSGPTRPVRTAIKLALGATAGSAIGGTATLLLARHGVLPPQPMTTPLMVSYARDHLAAYGPSGLWSQPQSGVPYKVYARVAGQGGTSAASWLAISAQVRCIRMIAVALLAAIVQRLTRRWHHLYTKAVAAGLLTFVFGLCLVFTEWSKTSAP
jgi:1-acyl-sn-glycerol-3-phosphate acyltransferase